MAELVPEGAWDCHTHVFDPSNYPYSPKRSYTPKAAQMSEYPSEVTGCNKVVIVHASVQGSSPAPLVDTLDKQNTSAKGYTLRGLATIDVDNITDAELDELHKQGVRGARLHEMAWGHGQQSGGSDIIRKVTRLAERFARLEWSIGIFCPISVWAAMADTIRNMDPRVKVIADHFGGTFPGEEQEADFQSFLALVREKRLWVKVSGFERLYDGNDLGIDAIEPIARPIIEAGPDRIIYGSDWPHTLLGVSRQGKTDEQRLSDIEGFRDVPDAMHIRKIRGWITDDKTWHALFVDNPNKLFA